MSEFEIINMSKVRRALSEEDEGEESEEKSEDSNLLAETEHSDWENEGIEKTESNVKFSEEWINETFKKIYKDLEKLRIELIESSDDSWDSKSMFHL